MIIIKLSFYKLKYLITHQGFVNFLSSFYLNPWRSSSHDSTCYFRIPFDWHGHGLTNVCNWSGSVLGSLQHAWFACRFAHHSFACSDTDHGIAFRPTFLPFDFHTRKIKSKLALSKLQLWREWCDWSRKDLRSSMNCKRIRTPKYKGKTLWCHSTLNRWITTNLPKR